MRPTRQPTTPSAPAPSVQVTDPAGGGSWLGLRDLEREAAITALFDRQHTELVRMAALLGADQDAEDVVAEAFCELYRRWPRLRDPQAAPAYLRSVVCNLTRMRLRHLQVVRRHHEPALPDAGSAEQQVVLREDQREVVVALRELPDRQRQALVLRYWLDLKEVDVAAAMGISCGAVKTHTSRGMAALTRKLGSRQ
jgi:RNA polymerase sigma-70 factor (sigma-E family)